MKKCRICDTSHEEHLFECDNCWEVYTRLTGMSKELIIKLLKEADVYKYFNTVS